MKRRIRFAIPEEYAGRSLLEFLCARFPYHSAAEWEERIGKGLVLVNGRAGAASGKLACGDVVGYTATDVPEPVVDDRVEILYDDADIVVVNKPGNLPCHPGGRYFKHTLWGILKNRFGVESPEMVNRLDRETSGVMLVARHGEASKKCRAQFSSRQVWKRYAALVEGAFPAEASAHGFVVADETSANPKRCRFVSASVEERDGRESEWAETAFRGVRCVGPVSLVEAIPHTGRQHQIRATLLALGFPVVGDKLYGVDPGVFVRFCREELTEADRERMRMGRQALHAAALRFRHPRTRKELEIEAPLPKDMDDLMRRLGAGR